MADHVFWSTTAMSSAITVRVGDTVTWENTGNTWHNARAEDGSWASPNLAPGESFSRAFTQPGEYRYICSLHVVEEMFGTVTVEGSSATNRVFVPSVPR